MVILPSIYKIHADDALAFAFIIFSITVLGIDILGGIFETTQLLNLMG